MQITDAKRGRSGYAVYWGDRQYLLEALYTNLGDKSRAHAGKEVVEVQHSEDEVTIKCSDGSAYHADILVGADGVNSKTRTVLWDLAGPEQPALVAAEKQRETTPHDS
jgi:2-polyprenyl-6-methoxyphenol hydroxylase-like FAD-dependent oxidoreductase